MNNTLLIYTTLVIPVIKMRACGLLLPDNADAQKTIMNPQ